MEYLVVIVIWLLCGIVSLQIAKERHAVNPMYWMVIGFLLGPFGVLFASFAPVADNAKIPPQPKPGRDG